MRGYGSVGYGSGRLKIRGRMGTGVPTRDRKGVRGSGGWRGDPSLHPFIASSFLIPSAGAGPSAEGGAGDKDGKADEPFAELAAAEGEGEEGHEAGDLGEVGG